MHATPQAVKRRLLLAGTTADAATPSPDIYLGVLQQALREGVLAPTQLNVILTAARRAMQHQAAQSEHVVATNAPAANGREVGPVPQASGSQGSSDSGGSDGEIRVGSRVPSSCSCMDPILSTCALVPVVMCITISLCQCRTCP